jgi:hypothetical protein
MATESSWEYGILAQGLAVKPEAIAASGAELTQELMDQLNQQLDQVNALVRDPSRFGQPGPIELLSHDIVLVGQTLVLSLLVRRPRQESPQ